MLVYNFFITKMRRKRHDFLALATIGLSLSVVGGAYLLNNETSSFPVEAASGTTYYYSSQSYITSNGSTYNGHTLYTLSSIISLSLEPNTGKIVITDIAKDAPFDFVNDTLIGLSSSGEGTAEQAYSFFYSDGSSGDTTYWAARGSDYHSFSQPSVFSSSSSDTEWETYFPITALGSNGFTLLQVFQCANYGQAIAQIIFGSSVTSSEANSKAWSDYTNTKDMYIGFAPICSTSPSTSIPDTVTLTIPAANLPSATLRSSLASFTVDLSKQSLTSLTSNALPYVKSDNTYSLTLTAATGHKLPRQSGISVTGGEIDTYNQTTGVLTLKNVTKDLVINAEADLSVADVSVTPITYDGASTVESALPSTTFYTASYSPSPSVNAGTYTATLSLNDGFVWADGTYDDKEVDYVITTVDMDAVELTMDSLFPYTGSPIDVASKITLKYGALTLKKGTDYEVSFQGDNTSPGSQSGTITGKGNYVGTKTLSYNINECPLSATSSSFSQDSFTYTGSPIDVSSLLNLSLGSTRLELGTDYEITSYSDNTNAGTCTVTLTGGGDYKGTTTASFTIAPMEIDQLTASISMNIFSYTGSSVNWQDYVNVTRASTDLVYGTDYEVVASSNGNQPGLHSLQINGKGNYTGNKTVSYSINEGPISSSIPTLSQNSFTYSGSSVDLANYLSLSFGGATLVNGTDYEITYSGNTNAGTYTATLTGKGYYSGSQDVEFTIEPAAIDGFSFVIDPSSFTYSSLEIGVSSSLSVTNGSTTLVEGTDYEIVSYSNNTNVGTASVTVQGKGNYTGIKTLNFSIVAFDASNIVVSYDASVSYSKDGCHPFITCVDPLGSAPLVLGADYEVVYSSDKHAGTASFQIQGLGNYTGLSSPYTYQILSLPFDTDNFSLTYPTQVVASKDGSISLSSLLTVKDGTSELTEDVDYQIQYPNTINNDELATITIKGLGDYSGTLSFQIKTFVSTDYVNDSNNGYAGLTKGNDEDFADIDVNDKETIEEAKSNYESASNDEKAIIDEYASEQGYSSGSSMLDDMANKVEVEEKKDAAIAKLEGKLKAHDSEYETSTYRYVTSQIQAINDISYSKQTDDAAREEHLGNVVSSISDTVSASEDKLPFVQKQGQALTSLEQYAEELKAQYEGNQEVIDNIESTLTEAKIQVSGVSYDPSDPTGSIESLTEVASKQHAKLSAFEPSSSPSLSWLWILLSILFFLLILFIVLFIIIYKKKKEDDEDEKQNPTMRSNV